MYAYVLLNPNEHTDVFSTEERVDFLERIVDGKGLSDKVEIKPWEGLIVHQAQAEDVSFLVRGLRAYGDFESEFSMALMNRRLSKSVRGKASDGDSVSQTNPVHTRLRTPPSVEIRLRPRKESTLTQSLSSPPKSTSTALAVSFARLQDSARRYRNSYHQNSKRRC